MYMKKAISLFLFSAFLSAADLPPEEPESMTLQVAKLQNTSFNENILVQFYTKGILKPDEPIFFDIRSFPLGVNTSAEQFRGMRNNKFGTSVLLLINGKYRVYLNKAENNPFIEQRTYFTKKFRQFLPKDITSQLQAGQLVMTAVALSSYRESIKYNNAIKTRVVNYISSKEINLELDKKLRSPYVLYNEPYGQFQVADPILLDFLVMNVPLSPNDYNVKVFIDGALETTLAEWLPYQIRGLLPGKHTVKLVLVNGKGAEVPGPFGPQEQTIEIK
jgi:hypothetical protein